jgi:nucleotide-binding universal stress UspA family protein
MQHDTRILACIDLADEAHSVCDHAAWAAQRLGLGLELLHVIERHPQLGPDQDHSGSLGVNAQEQLLKQLSDADEDRSRRDREHARQFLNTLRERALAAGVAAVDTRQRHGDLEETVHTLGPSTQLLVMGQRSHTPPPALGEHVEWVVRAVRQPVLVVPPQFRAPQRVLLAHDGSAASRKRLSACAGHPLLQGLDVHLLMARREAGGDNHELQALAQSFEAQGHAVSTSQVVGEPAQAIEDSIRAQGIDLIVMGAYSHSWWHRLLRRSNTQNVLQRLNIAAWLWREGA